MNHGGAAFLGDAPPEIPSGPRAPSLQLGLPSARASQNILRLLESSHGIDNRFASLDAISPSFHPTSKIWTKQGSWKALPIMNMPTAAVEKFPTISWLQFSDERTALAKVSATDGSLRYLSLLQVTNDEMIDAAPGGRIANDGWVIVREVHSPITTASNETISVAQHVQSYQSALDCLQTYLDIEHGGGDLDYDRAKTLFHPDSSLLCVGVAPVNEAPTEWSSPVGSLLEISLETYLEGVRGQTPHEVASRQQDAILQLDLSGDMGVAVVRVGNGAQSMTFLDHLMLGKDPSSGDWTILSKIFSPQPW